MNKEWQTKNGTLFALYDPFQKMVIITTKEYMVTEDASRKAKENTTIKGL